MQEYTEHTHTHTNLNDPDNHNGVATNLDLDIPDCEAKWALGSITTNKASGGDRMPAELFQILKDDAVKVHLPANLETQQWAQTGKASFLSNPKEGQCQRMLKLSYDCAHFAYWQGYAQNPSS